MLDLKVLKFWVRVKMLIAMDIFLRVNIKFLKLQKLITLHLFTIVWTFIEIVLGIPYKKK